MDADIVDIQDLTDLIAQIDEQERCVWPIEVAVEDDNGEVRLVEYAWYDSTRKMLRLTLRNVLFQDNEEK